jgi:hypothetical protein
MFEDLVRATAGNVLEEMDGTRADKKRLKADVTKHVWSAYEEAVEGFRFHYPYSGADQTPWGTGGFLGLAESRDERRRFDVFLKRGRRRAKDEPAAGTRRARSGKHGLHARAVHPLSGAAILHSIAPAYQLRCRRYYSRND